MATCESPRKAVQIPKAALHGRQLSNSKDILLLNKNSCNFFHSLLRSPFGCHPLLFPHLAVRDLSNARTVHSPHDLLASYEPRCYAAPALSCKVHDRIGIGIGVHAISNTAPGSCQPRRRCTAGKISK